MSQPFRIAIHAILLARLFYVTQRGSIAMLIAARKPFDSMLLCNRLTPFNEQSIYLDPNQQF